MDRREEVSEFESIVGSYEPVHEQGMAILAYQQSQFWKMLTSVMALTWLILVVPVAWMVWTAAF